MADLNQRLSKNFLLRELLVSQEATRKNITEQFQPDDAVVRNLTNLCVNVLQPLRDQIKLSVNISSGYRCPRVNTAIRGAANSQHVFGEAADFSVPGKSIEWVYQKIRELGLPFDQLIQEFDQWVHVSYKAKGNRKHCLRAVKQGTKTVYLPDNK
jgi:SH3-like domain-containing protein